MLDGYRSRLEHKGPAGRLENQKLRLEQLSERLHREMKRKLEQTRRREEDASVRLHAGMKRRYETTLQRAALLAERLHGLSPTAKLVGGFGYVSREETAVQSVKELKKDGFVKPHRSYLVSLAKVRRIGKSEVLLEGNVSVPVSRSAAAGLKNMLYSYLEENAF